MGCGESKQAKENRIKKDEKHKAKRDITKEHNRVTEGLPDKNVKKAKKDAFKGVKVTVSGLSFALFAITQHAILVLALVINLFFSSVFWLFQFFPAYFLFFFR